MKPSGGPQVSFGRDELINPDPMVSDSKINTNKILIKININNYVLSSAI